MAESEQDSLSLKHFVNLLNKVNGGVDNNIFSDKDTFRLQVLLLHLYVDSLLIDIIKEDLKLHTDMVRQTEGFNARLHIIHAKGIIDDNGFKALKGLNSIRNDLQHKYEFNWQSMNEKVKNLKKLSALKVKGFKINIISQLEMVCVHYINILRGYMQRKKGEVEKSMILYLLDKGTGNMMFEVAPLKV